MEEDSVSHVEDKRPCPFLASYLSSVQQSDHFLLKLQHGTLSPDPDINGANKLVHYKSNYGKKIWSGNMEKLSTTSHEQDNAGLSKSMQNGTKRTFSEPLLPELEKGKKSRPDEIVNGQESKFQANGSQTEEYGANQCMEVNRQASQLSHLKNDQSFNLRGSDHAGLQTQNVYKLDKKNATCHNGDVFSKKLSVFNGATGNASSLVNMRGDLLEKTLSQYCPDQVSIAKKGHTSHINNVDRQIIKQLSHGAVLSAHPSELTISTQSSLSAVFQEPLTTTSKINNTQNNSMTAGELQLSPQLFQAQQQQLQQQQQQDDQQLRFGMILTNGHNLKDNMTQSPRGNSSVKPSNDMHASSSSNECFTKQSDLQDSFFNQSSSLKEELYTTSLTSCGRPHSTGLTKVMHFYPSSNNIHQGEPSMKPPMSASFPALSQSQNVQDRLSYPSEFHQAAVNENGLQSTLSPHNQQHEGVKQTSQQLAHDLQPPTGLHYLAHTQQQSSKRNLMTQFSKQTSEIQDKTHTLPYGEKEMDSMSKTGSFTKQSWIALNCTGSPQSICANKNNASLLKSFHHLQSGDSEPEEKQKHLYTSNPNSETCIQMQSYNQDIPHLNETNLAHSSQMHSLYVQQIQENPEVQSYVPQGSHFQVSMESENEQNSNPQIQQHLFQNHHRTESSLQLHHLQQTTQQHLCENSPQSREHSKQDSKAFNRNNTIPLDKTSEALQSDTERHVNCIRMNSAHTLSAHFERHTPQMDQDQVQNALRTNSAHETPESQTQKFQHSSAHFTSDEKEKAVNHNSPPYPKAVRYTHIPPCPSTVGSKQLQSHLQKWELQSELTLSSQAAQQRQKLSDSSKESVQCTVLQTDHQLPPPYLQSQQSCNQQGQQRDWKETEKHAALKWYLMQKQQQQMHNPKSMDSVHTSQPLIRDVNSQSDAGLLPPISQSETKFLKKAIKTETPSYECVNDRPKSIIETMEEHLNQIQISPLFDRHSQVLRSPMHVKVESSGPVTVLSSNLKSKEDNGSVPPSVIQAISASTRTPTKKLATSALSNFLESPSKLLDTPIKNLLDTPLKTQYEFPSCSCVEQIIEKDEGPYYTHLGAGPNVQAIREMMENRYGQKGKAIRIERLTYTGKEGKSSQGCPIAKWVIRRSSEEEKLLCLVRERQNHSCETAVIVIFILIWDGIPQSLADQLYGELKDTLWKCGVLTNRRCALNEERTCACQGLDPETCGASFSFGCSWSMYYNGCKFARSKVPRKFKLLGDDPKAEERLEQNFQNLADLMAPTYKKLAPDAYNNQIQFEHRAPDCRLGTKEGRPFSGVTACLDFCAHAHRDLHNMQNGSTLVCTLTREDNRESGKIPEEEQLHVLPLYRISSVDENGSKAGQEEKFRNGSIQVLTSFRCKVRKLPEPAKTCRQKKYESKKALAEKNAQQENISCKTEKDKSGSVKNKHSNSENTTPEKKPDTSSSTLEFQHFSNNRHPVSEISYPRSKPPSNFYLRFPNSAHPDPVSSHSVNSYPGSSAQTNAYNNLSYLNQANSLTAYTGSLNHSTPYAEYQFNGNMTTDNCPPYIGPYLPHSQHLDMYHYPSHNALNKLGLPPFHTVCRQQYDGGQVYDPRYFSYLGQNAQVDGYSGYSMRPNIPQIGSYPPFGHVHQPEPHFMEAASSLTSMLDHSSLDYASMSKGNHYYQHHNPYLLHEHNPSSSVFSNNQSHLPLQNKESELNLFPVNGISRILPSFNHERSDHLQGQINATTNLNVQGRLPQVFEQNGSSTKEDTDDVWSDNEHNFLDPEIGGVAIAPSHGSILIECAKKELHATTPLKDPDRRHPTRISLVFYQHKSMNEPKHGLALWEAKMAERAREREEECEKYGPDYVPAKSYGKKVKREPSESHDHSEPTSMRFIKSITQRTISGTTDSLVNTATYAFTRVTGPYNKCI
ncbi:methylcytosine dioxygenase TET2 [Protopterus annectens]|uniref:methylcytosine dioxygenase TET2 n=1 Tax=Protopterus annectens TaxID=7888 RepID=UPI001CFB49C7|nr:methylcytosine dioxygenase TET2 [Protopterus annectens]